MDNIPLDILNDIFLRLPAKSLLRFKCVCKSWYHLISSHDFVKRHLERSLSTKSNTHFVFRDPLLKLADFDTFDNAIELDYPFKDSDDFGGACIVGDYNGLLCLRKVDYHDLIITLFNPTTRTYKVLPYQPRPLHVAHLRPTFTYGFGYDSVAHDYKFVRILECFDEKTKTYSYDEAVVYSLKGNSWTMVLNDAPYLFSRRRGDGVLVDGALHWAIGSHYDEAPLPVVSFNLSTHKFGEVLIPQLDELDEYSDMFMHVGVIDGCLCILVNYEEDSEIWIMREYGVVESWTKLLRVAKQRDVDSLERTIAFSKSGKELFVTLSLHRATFIDLESNVIKDVKVFLNPSRRHDSRVCVENLLMLDDSCYFLHNEQEEGVTAIEEKTEEKKEEE